MKRYKKKILNLFFLRKIKRVMIWNFLGSNKVFDRKTPFLVLNDKKCIVASIRRNINSIRFIDNIDDELRGIIEEEAIKQGYILTEDSPDFLKLNKKVVLFSVKCDVNTINYVPDKMKSDPEIFRELVKGGYVFSSEFLENMDLTYLCDDLILEFYFKYFRLYPKNSSDELSYRMRKIIRDTLKSKPRIASFNSFFELIAESEWNDYKQANSGIYENIFGKVCSVLRSSTSFKEAIESLYFLRKIEEFLNSGYSDFYRAMEEYYNIFHSDAPNKLARLQASQEIIAKCSAIYISRSKDRFIKDQVAEYQQTLLYEYYKINLDSTVVNKKIVQVKQKEKFRELYQTGDVEVCNFVRSLLEKYSKYENEKTLIKMIEGFIFYGYSDINEIINFPGDFRINQYKAFLKTLNLIKRLNSGNISLDGPEVRSYRHLIQYDEKTESYVYIGVSFTEEEKTMFAKYFNISRLFDLIKRDIMFKVKELDVSSDITKGLLTSIAKDLEFNDENYVFASEENLGLFIFEELFYGCIHGWYEYDLIGFTSDEIYEKMYNLLVDNGLNWLFMFIACSGNIRVFYDNGINCSAMYEMINKMDDIIKLSRELVVDISDFKNLLYVYKILQCADVRDIAILGKDIIERLCAEKDFTKDGDKYIISVASQLICHMSKRSKSTVPYISGEYLNYKYSMYDPLDASVLLSGLNTDACFRIAGNDHDFLHYCALNKNGFVIKIVDKFGNFVARASGFRNGNVVYINQLRTVNDIAGDIYNSSYESERQDIIETFRRACQDIVNISQNNSEEEEKIDFVFVTQSYALSSMSSNVSDAVISCIGDQPMDNASVAWDQYAEETSNLKSRSGFNTDYGNYPLICVAASKDIEHIGVEDIKNGDVLAVYERPRNKIIASIGPNIEIMRKLNKIKAIKSYFDMSDYEEIIVPNDSIVFLGDNWYIILNNGVIVNECLLEYDEKAKIEYQATIEFIKNNSIYNFCLETSVYEVIGNNGGIVKVLE